MRNDEELFEEWRLLMAKVFRHLYENQHQFSDLEREFTNTVKDEIQQWNGKLTQMAERSSFTRELLASAGRVGIGIIAGAVAGVATYTATGGSAGPFVGSLIGGIVGGTSQPALESVRDLARVLLNKPSAATIRHHFLALRVDDQ